MFVDMAFNSAANKASTSSGLILALSTIPVMVETPVAVDRMDVLSSVLMEFIRRGLKNREKCFARSDEHSQETGAGRGDETRNLPLVPLPTSPERVEHASRTPM